MCLFIRWLFFSLYIRDTLIHTQHTGLGHKHIILSHILLFQSIIRIRISFFFLLYRRNPLDSYISISSSSYVVVVVVIKCIIAMLGLVFISESISTCVQYKIFTWCSKLRFELLFAFRCKDTFQFYIFC